jgi:hypothetical protein
MVLILRGFDTVFIAIYGYLIIGLCLLILIRCLRLGVLAILFDSCDEILASLVSCLIGEVVAERLFYRDVAYL